MTKQFMSTCLQLNGPWEEILRDHSGDAWQVNTEDVQVLKQVRFNKEPLVAQFIGFGK